MPWSSGSADGAPGDRTVGIARRARARRAPRPGPATSRVGLGSYRTEAGTLAFELGPTGPIVLEWATYFDASDQAGQSRLFGGIHIRADDFTGRRLGSLCGIAAWDLARTYFVGEAPTFHAACRARP